MGSWKGGGQCGMRWASVVVFIKRSFFWLFSCLIRSHAHTRGNATHTLLLISWFRSADYSFVQTYRMNWILDKKTLHIRTQIMTTSNRLKTTTTKPDTSKLRHMAHSLSAYTRNYIISQRGSVCVCVSLCYFKGTVDGRAWRQKATDGDIEHGVPRGMSCGRVYLITLIWRYCCGCTALWSLTYDEMFAFHHTHTHKHSYPNGCFENSVVRRVALLHAHATRFYIFFFFILVDSIFRFSFRSIL